MASAPTPPPLLPVTNSAPGSSPATAGGSDAPIAQPAFRLFLSRPDSVSDATSRLRRNLAYFRVNYAAVVAFALGASLLAHPFSLLILLGLLAAWCFLYLFRASDQPVVLFGRTFSDRETLMGLVGASFVLLFFTSVASLIISGLLVGGALVAAHGAFRVPEDLFLDEPNAAAGNSAAQGLLSFLGAPGSGV
ncbi:hypothetical protein PVAP13_3KG483535 [Panicum virgatum]|uniref:PRA1 family protein n=1 Tax=Panicum virgatum TaxID=38727 RepID=A0A8T0UXU7_PANVG|nr:hypothetical protein PVAP13_3KG483535 [Panicum virgatum]